MSNLDVTLRLRMTQQLGGPAKEAKRELEGVGAAAKKLDGAKADKLARDIAKTKTEATAAGAALEKTAAGAKKLDPAKADRLARGLGKSKTEALGSERALRQVVNALRQLDGTRAERLGASLRRANTAAESLARSLRRVRTEGHGVGGDGSGGGLKRPTASGGGGAMPAIIAGGARAAGMLGVGYLGYRTVASGVRSVVEQDKAWAEVRKKVNGSPEQLTQLQEELRAMARQYGMSIAEAFGQAADAGAAGIDIGEIKEAVRTALMASKAWDTNARETMKYMAQMKSAMGWNLGTLRDWSDKVNALADASAAAERDLVEAAKRSTAPGAAAGVDPDTVLAITAAQISGGMPEEVASRWFNTFVSKLAGANAGTKKQKEALSKHLKLDPKVVAKGMEKDARATIMEVLKRFNDLGQQQRIEFGVSFFGQEWWDETARAARVIPEITRMFEILGDKEKWSGSTQQNLNIELSTTANHWERIKVAASEVANQIDRATGASKGFNAASESLLSMFERWIGKGAGAEGKKPGPEQPRADEPAGPKSRFPGRMQSYEHARATREALRARAPKLSDFSGRNQMEDYKRAKAKYEAEQRAMRPARGPMTPLPEVPNYTPVPGSHRSGIPLPVPRPTARNYTPTPPDAAANALRQIGSPVPPAAADQAETTLRRITQAVTTEGGKAVVASRSAAEQVRAIWNFSVSPQISPRFGGAAGGGSAGGAGAGSGGASPAPAPAAPSGKRAGLGGSFNVAVTVNGAGKNGRQIGSEIARELAKLGNSSSSLFDTV